MPYVTALLPSKRAGRRWRLEVDGVFVAEVEDFFVATYHLQVGLELSVEQVAEIERAATLERLQSGCLRLLANRPHSEAELRLYLRRRAATSDQIEQVIEALRQQHLIDDEAFARFWRESRDRFAPRGQPSLQAELRGKGIARSIIADVLPDREEEEVLARAAAERHARTIRAATWQSFRQSMWGFLQRRGFPYGIAAHVTRELWEARTGAAVEDEDAAETP